MNWEHSLLLLTLVDSYFANYECASSAPDIGTNKWKKTQDVWLYSSFLDEEAQATCGVRVGDRYRTVTITGSRRLTPTPWSTLEAQRWISEFPQYLSNPKVEHNQRLVNDLMQHTQRRMQISIMGRDRSAKTPNKNQLAELLKSEGRYTALQKVL